jgi:magnesium transporter
LLLKERFTRYSLIGTVLTCAGAALVATFGAIGEPAHSLRQLLELLAQRDFIIWMSGTLIVVVETGYLPSLASDPV